MILTVEIHLNKSVSAGFFGPLTTQKDVKKVTTNLVALKCGTETFPCETFLREQTNPLIT